MVFLKGNNYRAVMPGPQHLHTKEILKEKKKELLLLSGNTILIYNPRVYNNHLLTNTTFY